MAEPNHVQPSQEQEPIPKTEPVEEELDASLDADIDMVGTQQPSSLNMDGAGGEENNTTEAAAAAGLEAVGSAMDAKAVGKKDATLREFIGKMDEYAPIVRRQADS